MANLTVTLKYEDENGLGDMVYLTRTLRTRPDEAVERAHLLADAIVATFDRIALKDTNVSAPE